MAVAEIQFEEQIRWSAKIEYDRAAFEKWVAEGPVELTPVHEPSLLEAWLQERDELGEQWYDDVLDGDSATFVCIEDRQLTSAKDPATPEVK